MEVEGINSVNKMGYSMGDIVTIVILRHTAERAYNATELYELYTSMFPSMPVGYEYVQKIGKKLETIGAVELFDQVQQKKYYQITNTGKKMLHDYLKAYNHQFTDLIKLIHYIYEDVQTPKSRPGVSVPLPPQYRRYFAKLVSVKDITRYNIFYLGQRRTDFYAAEALVRMKEIYGWAPSNGYFYDIVREMEAEGTITGHWKDSEKRTIRLIRITEDGVVFNKRITADLMAQIEDVLKYFNTIHGLLEEKETSLKKLSSLA
jgi:DNA-binding PadR family transcriptional regulator